MIPTSFGALAAAKTTWSPFYKDTGITLSGGDLVATAATASTEQIVKATAAKSAGRWHFEVTINAVTSFASRPSVGLANAACSLTEFLGFRTNGIAWNAGGNVWTNNVAVTAYLSFTSGDILAVEYDADADLVYLWKNGSARSAGISTASISGALFPALDLWGDGALTDAVVGNFAGPFTVTPTAGYLPWL